MTINKLQQKMLLLFFVYYHTLCARKKVATDLMMGSGKIFNLKNDNLPTYGPVEMAFHNENYNIRNRLWSSGTE